MERSPANGLREAALLIQRNCGFRDTKHASQVAGLSLSLFDQLSPLHGLASGDRKLLEAAALLHDVGLTRGNKGHHKASRDIIIRSRLLPLGARRRVMLGLIVRYHRKSLPRISHRYFSALDAGSRLAVEKLASLLRFADGLDRSHRSNVKEVVCSISPHQIAVRIKQSGTGQDDVEGGKMKADLLRRVYGKRIRIVPRPQLPFRRYAGPERQRLK